ncbi:MAG: hypothetical protein K5893_00420 [Prevotella sp.]|nr:hypothetical protein [Prevotella sp.]
MKTNFKSETMKVVRKYMNGVNVMKFCMMVALIVMSQVATAQTDVWTNEGNRDTNWYPDYNDATELTITNEAQMAQFCYMLNNATTPCTFEGKTIVLKNHLDMSAKNWLSLGSADTEFKGTFDGNGYSIKGIKLSSTNGYQGLFGQIGEGGVVKNLRLYSVDIQSNGSYNGSIAGINKGTITNCQIGNIYNGVLVVAIATTNKASFIGGIVGLNEKGATISGCYITGKISHSGNGIAKKYGGVAGDNNGTIRDCIAQNITLPTDESVIYKAAITPTVPNTNDYVGTLVNCYYDNCNEDRATMFEEELKKAMKAVKLTLTTGVGIDGRNNAYCDEMVAYENGIYFPHTRVFYTGENLKVKFTYNGTVADDEYVAGFQNEDGNELDWSVKKGDIEVYPLLLKWADRDWAKESEGSEIDPYIIYRPVQLDLLASRVNAGGTYEGKYFVLANDIEYNGTENNYQPIGNVSTKYYFAGTFDGKGYAISGINVNKTTGRQAIFGVMKGTVKDLTLKNSTICGGDATGGIVGRLFGGTIHNCHVEGSVAIQGSRNNYHGGIAGVIVGGSISACTSAASVSGNYYVGGIVGACGEPGMEVLYKALVKECFYYGNDINASNAQKGAISGKTIEGNTVTSYENNFYFTSAADLKGVNSDVISDNHGAVQVYDDIKKYDLGEQLALLDNDYIIYAYGIKVGEKTYTCAVSLYDSEDNTEVLNQLAGRTLDVMYPERTIAKDNQWSTICLPFNVDKRKGTVLENAFLMPLTSSELRNDGTLYIRFKNTSSTLEAGRPYLLRYYDATDIVAPVFRQVTIAGSDLYEETSDVVNFCGTNKPMSYEQKEKSLFFLSDAGYLFTPEGDSTVGIDGFRGYFQLNNGYACGKNIHHIMIEAANYERMTLDFATISTDIENISVAESDIDDNAQWYTLDGKRMQGKPATKGIYIVNGKKVVLK